MTDLTPRELFDAIERSLRDTGRRFTRLGKQVAKQRTKVSEQATKIRRPQKKSKKGARRKHHA